MKQNKLTEAINVLKAKKLDIKTRELTCRDETIVICFIEQMTDRLALMEYLIKPMMQYCSEAKTPPDASCAANNIIYADKLEVCTDPGKLENYLLKGLTAVAFLRDEKYIVVDFKRVEHRNITAPEVMYSYRGPRDAFVEELDVNLSLLRNRLKDKNLNIEKTELGKRTKSTVAMLYIRDIANEAMIKEIKKRISSIEVDGIYESGELQEYLLNNRFNFFPIIGIVERPDLAVEALLEGKAVIMVDGSCIALQAPKVFIEFLYSSDDRYENKFFGTFMRSIRYIAIILSLTATSVYVALAQFHSDIMPPYYIVTFAQMRSRSPFSALIAVLILEFIVELMREALLRVPTKIGSAIAIVGAIIIGQAASASGIFSPLLLILVSIGFLSTFAIPDFTMSNILRILKFFIILLTGLFGFYGFSLAVTAIFMQLVSKNSFGVPYMAPYSPFNFYDFVRTLLFSRNTSPKRQQYMRTRDDRRSNNTNDNRRSGNTNDNGRSNP